MINKENDMADLTEHQEADAETLATYLPADLLNTCLTMYTITESDKVEVIKRAIAILQK